MLPGSNSSVFRCLSDSGTEPTMNTKHISYILEIAEQKNITKAAEKLYVSQSTLSQCLANLESELGTPLFYRHSKELSPTPAGLCYLEGAKKMLEIKKQVYDTIADMAANKRWILPLEFPPKKESAYSPKSRPFTRKIIPMSPFISWKTTASP